jgi:cytochrome b561
MDTRTSYRSELEMDGGSFLDVPQLPQTRETVRTRHPALTIALHWGTVLAIVVSVAAMFLRDASEDRVVRQVLLEIHRQLGLLVLIVVALRLGLRMRARLADYSSTVPAVLRWVAHAAHIVLYGMLIALPVEGWLLSNAHGVSLALFGIVPLPSLQAPDSELADTLSDYHILLAWGLLALVTAHAAAAFWHHFMQRDGVLRAMLPSWLLR